MAASYLVCLAALMSDAVCAVLKGSYEPDRENGMNEVCSALVFQGLLYVYEAGGRSVRDREELFL